jgi:uncharacterized membrane protein YraQ (UPF0718 family)
MDYKAFALNHSARLVKSFDFFIYNLFKVYILILIFGFIIGLIRGFIPPAKTKKLLSKTTVGVGNFLAAILAVITPVESFSVVPLFISFLRADVPLSIAFTYLIVAPITNEIAFALFWGLFGYKVAFIYYGAGVIVGLLGGVILGLVKSGKDIEAFVYSENTIGFENNVNNSLKDIVIYAKESSWTFFKSFWLYILIGIGIASIVNGYMPQSLLIKYIGGHHPFVVPIVVVIMTFFYLNIAMAMPLILILVTGGLPIGTVLAFTMAVTATSIPELFILKRALKWSLLLVYFLVLISLIILAGIIINLIC